MTRSSRYRGEGIAAAKWPMLFIGSVVLVAIVVAVPFVVHAVVQETIGERAAAWAAAALGGGMLVAIAIAWVLLRAKRHEPEDTARGFEPT